MATRKTTAKKIDWLNVAAIAATIIAALFIIKKVVENIRLKRLQKEAEKAPPPSTPIPGGNTGINPLDMGKLLKKGVNGQEVAALQTFLVADGATLPKFGVDGKFGAETEAALMQVKGVKEIRLKDYTSTKK